MTIRTFPPSHSFLSGHWYVLAVFGFLLFGCTEPLYWAKSGAQAGEFERDIVTCQEELGVPIGGKGGKGFSVLDPKIGTASVAMEQCLADKGWFLARKPVP